jgi:hypothetical protein
MPNKTIEDSGCLALIILYIFHYLAVDLPDTLIEPQNHYPRDNIISEVWPGELAAGGERKMNLKITSIDPVIENNGFGGQRFFHIDIRFHLTSG